MATVGGVSGGAGGQREACAAGPRSPGPFTVNGGSGSAFGTFASPFSAPRQAHQIGSGALQLSANSNYSGATVIVTCSSSRTQPSNAHNASADVPVRHHRLARYRPLLGLTGQL
jgi:autotransporter-associated beta strand protein